MADITVAISSTSVNRNLRRWKTQAILLVAGLSIGIYLGYSTEIAAPVHEVGHWIIGGPDAHIVAWNRTEGLAWNPDQIVAGFRFQCYVLMAVGLSVSALFSWRKGLFSVGSPLMGLSVGAYFYAFESTDFNVLPYEFFEGTEVNVPQYIAEVKTMWISRMGVILGLVCLIALYIWLVRGYKKTAT